MNDWQSTYLGRGALPRDLSGFEIEAFFTYSESERRVIDDERRSSALKLALALQIGFLRMTGRLLEALRLVPPAVATSGRAVRDRRAGLGLAAYHVPSASHIV
jgi:hypothetical protein